MKKTKIYIGFCLFGPQKKNVRQERYYFKHKTSGLICMKCAA